ncbi:hypothetical protein Tco_1404452 [Tanacetum coccineum]
MSISTDATWRYKDVTVTDGRQDSKLIHQLWFLRGPTEYDYTIFRLGGALYIGSHTVLQLLLYDYKIVVINNLDNSSHVDVNRVKELVGPSSATIGYDEYTLLKSSSKKANTQKGHSSQIKEEITELKR